MKKLSERNIFPDFDLNVEYKKIEYMLSEYQLIFMIDKWGDVVRGRLNAFSIEGFVNLAFMKWHLRGTFLSVDEMRTALGIDNKQMNKHTLTADTVLDFLQYAVNSINYVETTFNSYHNYRLDLRDKSHLKSILQNIDELLKYLKANINYDEKNGEFYVCYSDETSDTVALQHPEIEVSLSDYLRIDNRKDLRRKGEILCSLFKKLESVEDKFKGTEFTRLISDTTFLFNKIGARHYTGKDKIAVATFEKMSDTEIEIWYDKAFTLFLSCMAVLPYIDIKVEIKNIKILSE